MGDYANPARVRWPDADSSPVLQRIPASPAARDGHADLGAQELVGIADAAVQRLIGVGLLLEAATEKADGAAAEQIQRAATELDAIIRDIRTAAFGIGQAPSVGSLDTGWL